MSTRQSERVVNILLVEGDPGDTNLIRKAFELGGTANKIHAVKNAKEAETFLLQVQKEKSIPKPDLIILDIEISGPDGPNLLTVLKTDDNLSSIPVVALTHSADSQEVTESYRLHANCLIKKPVQVRSFLEVIKAIDYFWTEIVTLPNDI